MSGIVAYTGTRDAYGIMVKGLHRLEHLGCDSAGVALSGDSIRVFKKQGQVHVLEQTVTGKDISGHTGIAHTRWATHGEPSDRNAHPHLSASGRLAIVQNGIIENYASLRQELGRKGYGFRTDTDTEVLLTFIDDIMQRNACPLEEALRVALKRVVGAYVIVLLDRDQPDTLIAARRGSPLVIGIGKGEHFLASDASAIMEYSKDVVYVSDYEMAIIRPDELILKNLGNEKITPFVQKLDLELTRMEKGGFPYFMLKEIFEQPDTLKDCLRGRFDARKGTIIMSGVEKYISRLAGASRYIFVACGTSSHAGLVAEYFFESCCRIPAEVEFASEFRYRNPVIQPGDVIIAISQSGETADSIVALEKAREQGAFVFGVVNVVGSSISRLAHAGAYTHAGPEISVVSTKAFTTQLAVLFLIALRIAVENKTIGQDRFRGLLAELARIPEKMREILARADEIRALAIKYSDCRDALFLGRGFQYPVSLEGALKLKEVSYVHAEAYPAAEMKHGPIALVDENLPVIFIATKDAHYDQIVSNIQEIKARKGKVIAIVSEGDEIVSSIADDYFVVPVADEMLSPLLTVIPLQLFACYLGMEKGVDVDNPRNLSKSVAVE